MVKTTALQPRASLDARAAVLAGLISGVVFLMMEMILLALVGQSPWGPPRMMAAMVLGEGVLPPPATFDLGIVVVALIVHFVLSIIYAFILAWIIAWFAMEIAMAIAAGLAFGLVIYLINFHIFAPLLFPWFEMAQNWITVVSHAVYGVVLAWAYVALARRAAYG